MIRFRLFIILCLFFVITGCGYNMALTKGQTDIDVTKKSIALLSVKISNQCSPKYQLDIMGSLICPDSERCGHGSVKYFRKTNSSYRINSVENSFNEYLLSYELESGSYNFHSIGAAHDQYGISGGGSVPLNFKFEIKSNSITYLGHLDIVMRKMKNNSEIRAGRVGPPWQQNPVVGAYTGTYDVVVENKFEEDMKLFISEYPALKNAKVEKAILPQWIRPENQPAN
jgi:hypothetical protein